MVLCYESETVLGVVAAMVTMGVLLLVMVAITVWRCVRGCVIRRRERLREDDETPHSSVLSSPMYRPAGPPGSRSMETKKEVGVAVPMRPASSRPAVPSASVPGDEVVAIYPDIPNEGGAPWSMSVWPAAIHPV